MQPYLNTAINDDECNPAEEAALRGFVARTTVTCPAIAIQTAVTTAAIVFGQDWSQEGRKVMRELGIQQFDKPCVLSIA